MPIHVAILRAPYPKLILDGRKTIESRLTKQPLEPFQKISTGERIFIKQSSGPFVATAIAGAVHFFDQLTRPKVAALKTRFNEAVCGDDEFWEWKRDSRFASFIELTQVQPWDRGPKMKPSSGLAWFVLPDALSPRVPVMFEVRLTQGAIKNHYVRVPLNVHTFDHSHYGGSTAADASKPITLVFPDGTQIQTDLVGGKTRRWCNGVLNRMGMLRGHMIRWRGWHAYFTAHHMLPGDAVRFVEREHGEYGVSFVHRSV